MVGGRVRLEQEDALDRTGGEQTRCLRDDRAVREMRSQRRVRIIKFYRGKYSCSGYGD